MPDILLRVILSRDEARVVQEILTDATLPRLDFHPRESALLSGPLAVYDAIAESLAKEGL